MIQKNMNISYSAIMLSTLPFLLIAPVATYYIATRLEGLERFPEIAISNTAYFYPQNIIFRYLMLI